MARDELRARKNRERAAGRDAAYRLFMDGGPFLQDDAIIVPTPYKDDGVTERLKRAGFRYMGDPDTPWPHWTRDAGRTFCWRGRHYHKSSGEWLAWARKVWAQAFMREEQDQ